MANEQATLAIGTELKDAAGAIEQQLEEEAEEPSGESAQQDDETPKEPEEEAGPLTLEAIAEASGGTIQDLMEQTRITLRADGADQEITLAELQSGYQKGANYTRQTMELAEQRKALEADHQAKAQALDSSLQMVGAWMGQVKNVVLGQMNTPDMQALRTANPQEWTARQMDAQNLSHTLDQLFQQVTSAYGQNRQAMQKTEEENFTEFRNSQGARLGELIPDWSKETDQKITQYLGGYGFNAEEIQGVSDARHVAIAHKAMLWDQLQAVGGKLKKKVISLPKSISSGKGKSRSVGVKKKRLESKAVHAKTKTVQSAADAMKGMDL